jgi:O-antigen biosynthesis protein
VNPLDHPVIFSTPRRLTRVSAWREHVPFAMLLVDLLKPATFVELGTHWGTSYCAFCQAVDGLKLPTKCYAVDTWAGDPHSGGYGPEVLADLRAHHDPLYSSFSRLIQSSFDDASALFTDGSVDLLHLDGYHTYDAVRHDYDTWLPKISDRGVIVLHDINARRRDFGAWRLWDEVRSQYAHLELLHAHGLGILAVGNSQPNEFIELLESPPAALSSLRQLLFHLGQRLRLQLMLEDTRRKGLRRHEALRAATKQLRAVEGELDELRGSRLVRYSESLRNVRERVRRDGADADVQLKRQAPQ